MKSKSYDIGCLIGALVLVWVGGWSYKVYVKPWLPWVYETYVKP